MDLYLLALLARVASAWVAGEPSLRWHETTQTLEAPPSAEQAAAAFGFVNEADHPVTITRVHSSCGCTIATLDKTIQAVPGPTLSRSCSGAYGISMISC